MRTITPLVVLAILAACGSEPAPPPPTGNTPDAAPGSAADAPAAPKVPALRVASAEPPTAKASAPQAGPCRMQNGAVLAANALRAVGTEPFWGARVEGRCVTYSHPENQQGTRLWTRFEGSAESGTWTGTYQNQPFVLRTRPQPGCSEGMSDNRYPLAVELTVAGEQRSGCAEPATGR